MEPFQKTPPSYASTFQKTLVWPARNVEDEVETFKSVEVPVAPAPVRGQPTKAPRGGLSGFVTNTVFNPANYDDLKNGGMGAAITAWGYKNDDTRLKRSGAIKMVQALSRILGRKK